MSKKQKAAARARRYKDLLAGAPAELHETLRWATDLHAAHDRLLNGEFELRGSQTTSSTSTRPGGTATACGG